MIKRNPLTRLGNIIVSLLLVIILLLTLLFFTVALSPQPTPNKASRIKANGRALWQGGKPFCHPEYQNWLYDEQYGGYWNQAWCKHKIYQDVNGNPKIFDRQLIEGPYYKIQLPVDKKLSLKAKS